MEYDLTHRLQMALSNRGYTNNMLFYPFSIMSTILYMCLMFHMLSLKYPRILGCDTVV